MEFNKKNIRSQQHASNNKTFIISLLKTKFYDTNK